MRLLLLANIFVAIWSFLNRFSEINNYINSAEQNFKKGEYELAIKDYTILINNYKIKDEDILLNLAHSYYNIQDTSNSKKIYQNLLNSEDRITRSIAHQQLGNVFWMTGKKNKAIYHYTESLKANSANETARINFELIQKLIKLEEQYQTGVRYKKEKQASNQRNTGKASDKSQAGSGESIGSSGDKGSNNTEKSASEGSGEHQGTQSDPENEKNELRNQKNGNKENEDLISNRLKAANLSLQRARAILDAMKQNEIQYLQQKQMAKPEAEQDLPDW
ncbi:MAG: tetratricopeptide repeat protein [Sporocytophaga sp.]|nr:tetratricopeptide repeat protein [Sporocytophaga sp.]